MPAGRAGVVTRMRVAETRWIFVTAVPPNHALVAEPTAGPDRSTLVPPRTGPATTDRLTVPGTVTAAAAAVVTAGAAVGTAASAAVAGSSVTAVARLTAEASRRLTRR